MCEIILPNGCKGFEIPDTVLNDILRVFSFATQEDLKRSPNNIICDIEGNFLTTWDKVFEIRAQIEKEKLKNKINS